MLPYHRDYQPYVYYKRCHDILLIKKSSIQKFNIEGSILCAYKFEKKMSSDEFISGYIAKNFIIFT